MTRLYITGGGGFIASHFLCAHRFDFDAICAPQRREASSRDGHIERPHTDGEVSDLCRLLTDFKPDIVLNFAAAGVNPDERGAELLTQVNTHLPVNLFSAARDCGAEAFVQIGSMAEYAAPEGAKALRETDSVTSANPYGVSKAAATLKLSILSEPSGITSFILRLFGVYGPEESPHRLTSHIVKQIGKGLEVPLSAGTQQRDFIYIRDVVSAVYAASQTALKKDGGYEIINIGSGKAISVKDFVLDFCAAGKLDTSGLQFGAIPMRDTDAPYLVANISKAKELLEWTPQWVHEIGLVDFFNPRANL